MSDSEIGLNEPQARAVAHAAGPLVVFAGAGSGKTRVIVYRIANLLAAHRAPPFRVLAVTFTNRAAREMRARLEKILGEGAARELWVGTFHATCVRLLRQHAAAAGLARSFVIYDDDDQSRLVTRLLKELQLDDRRYPPRQVLGRIHKEKQEARGPEDMKIEGFFDEAIRRVFARYEEALGLANALDFDDILLRVLRLAEDREDPAGEAIRRRFSHVLVDEFQDVNQVQYRLVRALASRVRDGGSLCVVGDDDQSIYRWRGADVRIIRTFRRDFPDATIVKLEQNYRSSGNVVRAALGVIRHAEGREPKELWTAEAPGSPVRVVACDTEHDEAAFVAEQIHALVEAGVSPSEIAVFYRVHALSRVLEEVLRRQRIAYQIVGGTKFFERAEVKDLLSYLRVVASQRSDVDVLRVINVPARKIGDATVGRLLEVAAAEKIPVFEAIERVAPSLGTQARKAVLAFRDLIRELAAHAEAARPSEVAERILERSGYRAMLEAQRDADDEARLLNVEELVQSILDYEAEADAEGAAPTLDEYLARVSLTDAGDSLKDEERRVVLMTVHAAKGLEFHAVFLTGMEEDLFPFKSMDLERRGDLEEERRLAYVAITRARKELALTHVARRSVFGNTRYGIPSRFLRDVPQEIIAQSMTAAARLMSRTGEPPRPWDPGERRVEREPAAPPDGRRGPAEPPAEAFPPRGWAPDRADEPFVAPTPNFSGRGVVARPSFARPQAARPAARPVARAVERAAGERYVERDEPVGSALRAGVRVLHTHFGPGLVLGVDGGRDPTATVEFAGFGVKRIKASFLQPAPE